MQHAFAFQPVAEPLPAFSQGELILRDYQVAALTALVEARERGVVRALVVLPTGTGKGAVIGHVPQALGWRRTLAIAHRIEIVEQLADHFRRAMPGAVVDLEMAGTWADHNADVVVACVATLGRSRLARWPAYHFDGLVWDEAHHGAAESWGAIARHFGVTTGTPLVGFTATDFRGDGEELANVFDEVVYRRRLRDMIDLGWLVPLRAKTIWTETDISNIHTRYGEFNEQELATVANTSGRNALAVSAVEQHARDRDAIMAFCVNVAHVESLRDAFRSRGYAAEMVIGTTPIDERRRIVQDFRNGLVRILVSCGVFSEGTDLPRADTALMARPWKSALGYVQQVGRILRPHPDKHDALILDLVDNVGRHPIQSATTLFGVRSVDCLGELVLDVVDTVTAAVERGERVDQGDSVQDVRERVQHNLLGRIASGMYVVDTHAVAVDVFRETKLDPIIAEASIFPWIEIGPARYQLRMPTQTYRLELDLLHGWLVAVLSSRGVPLDVPVCRLGEQEGGAPWALADRVVKQWEPDAWRMKSMNARWRHNSATQKQVAALQRMGFRVLPEGLTAGAASDMFDVLAARRRRAREG